MVAKIPAGDIVEIDESPAMPAYQKPMCLCCRMRRRRSRLAGIECAKEKTLKLVRYGSAEQEKPGLIDNEGRLRDLGLTLGDIGPAQLSDAALDALRRIDSSTLPLVSGTPRLGCPISSVGKLIGIGLNYSDHAAETGSPIPKEPIIFMKATSCIQGADDPVMLPQDSQKTDWEVELGVVIGTRARHVSEDEALNRVASYCVINDGSERSYKMERGGT